MYKLHTLVEFTESGEIARRVNQTLFPLRTRRGSASTMSSTENSPDLKQASQNRIIHPYLSIPKRTYLPFDHKTATTT
jgi:hypothetical protein